MRLTQVCEAHSDAAHDGGLQPRLLEHLQGMGGSRPGEVVARQGQGCTRYR